MSSFVVYLTLYVGLVKLSNCASVFDNKFKEIRRAFTFIDKTPLVYEFLQHKFLFINAPSMFGKSTNMDMINLFLSNHRPKQEIEDTFIWTKIWENEDFVKNHMGQYPVIYFSLKVRGFSSDFDQTLNSLKVSLYNAFIDHTYLLESDKLSSDQRKELEIYTDLTGTRLMDKDSMARGLGILAEALYQHHGKPVVVLADEFGRGITEGILLNHIDLSSIVEVYSLILNNTLFNEKFISHALFSGESWLYGLEGSAVSSLERVSFMHKVEFSRFYGFTYDEVEHLLTKFNISKDQKKDIYNWYCGYSTYDGLFKVCNPYSISQYLSHRKKLVFWTGSALASDLIRRMVEVDLLKKHILDLVMKKAVNMNLEKDTKVMGVEFIRKKVEELPQYCENFFLQILVEAGYLTFAENQGQSSEIALVFPNEEVRSSVVRFTV